MIWFACPKCHKVHGRPENAIGAMVFAALLGVASGIPLMRLRQSSLPKRAEQREEHCA